ncbi:MAG: TVP38/TMEM64 family protein [bacterium]
MKDYKKWLKWIGAFIGLAVLVWLFEYFELRDQFRFWFKHTLTPWLDANPILGPFVYILVYVGAVVAFMPGSVITLAGGILFGPLWGTIYVSVASTGASGVAFLISRYIAGDWVQQKAEGKLEKIKDGIEDEGWRFVAFTRLIPIFPYNLLNYMFGLTRINFWVYLGVTWIAMIPGTFAYVYAGYASKAAVAGGQSVKRTLIIISIALGLLVFMSMLPSWIKKWKGEDIPEAVEEAEEGLKGS